MHSVQSLGDIAEYHADTERALRLMFSPANPEYLSRYALHLPTEVDAQLGERLDETDLRSSLMVLARVEAAFRMDYRRRGTTKPADDVSIALRKIYKTKKDKARLSDILDTWYDLTPPQDRVGISKLRSMFRLRHWLAHGRYWIYAPGYRFPDVYLVADTVMMDLSLPA